MYLVCCRRWRLYHTRSASVNF